MWVTEHLCLIPSRVSVDFWHHCQLLTNLNAREKNRIYRSPNSYSLCWTWTSEHVTQLQPYHHVANLLLSPNYSSMRRSKIPPFLRSLRHRAEEPSSHFLCITIVAVVLVNCNRVSFVLNYNEVRKCSNKNCKSSQHTFACVCVTSRKKKKTHAKRPSPFGNVQTSSRITLSERTQSTSHEHDDRKITFLVYLFSLFVSTEPVSVWVRV